MKSNGIVDWERDAPQWPALLQASRGAGPAAPPSDTALWPLYGPLAAPVRAGNSFVIGQMGQSLDGRIATATGRSHYINGPSAILHLHRLRALVDAVVIGVGTAIADDPRLSVRLVPGPQPARVVIDPHGRLPQGARCLAEDGVRRIVVGPGGAAARGIELLPIASSDEGFDPAGIVAALRAIGLSKLLIEGGGRTVSRFLAAGALHRLHVMVSPMVIGSGPVGLSYGNIDGLHDAVRPRVKIHALPDGDTLFDCEL